MGLSEVTTQVGRARAANIATGDWAGATALISECSWRSCVGNRRWAIVNMDRGALLLLLVLQVDSCSHVDQVCAKSCAIRRWQIWCYFPRSSGKESVKGFRTLQYPTARRGFRQRPGLCGTRPMWAATASVIVRAGRLFLPRRARRGACACWCSWPRFVAVQLTRSGLRSVAPGPRQSVSELSRRCLLLPAGQADRRPRTALSSPSSSDLLFGPTGVGVYDARGPAVPACRRSSSAS